MSATRIRLQTEDYQIRLKLRTEADQRIRARLRYKAGNRTFKSVRFALSAQEIEELIHYLNTHIDTLLLQPDTNAEVFVPWELGFQMRALMGNVIMNENGQPVGEFSLQSLLNVGQNPDNTSRVFIGGEARVSVEAIQAFIDELRTFLDTSQ